MFLGYTHSNKNSLQYSFNKLKNFYFTYWTYFLIFVPIGLIFFKDTTLWNSNEVRYSEDLLTLFEGISGWSSKYNSEWWFVRMFVLLLFFISPLYINLGKQKPFLLSFISISLFLISKILKVDYFGVLSVFFWQIMFAVGILCAKSKFFTSNFIRYFKSSKIILLILSILFFIIARFRFGAQIDFLFIPIFIYLAIRTIEMLRLSKILAYIGEYSFPLWLVHSFFCYYLMLRRSLKRFQGLPF